VVAQEAELGELTLGGGDGRALGMFPSINDTAHEATKCKEITKRVDERVSIEE
jgi:hypothetical protein